MVKDSGQGASAATVLNDPAAALRHVLACPAHESLVMAMSEDARIVPMPSSLPLAGQPTFEGSSGIDVIVPEEQLLVIDAWARAQEEPVVRLQVHLQADPARGSTLWFIDARTEHGVHVVALEDLDPDVINADARERAAIRREAAHVRRDGMGVFIDIDHAMTALLGYRRGDLIGRRTLEIVHPDDTERAIESWMAMRDGTPQGRVRIRYRHAAGHHVWVEVTNDNRLDDPEEPCVVSELVDITAEMAELEALHARERQLASLAEALPIGICHLRTDGEIVYTNAPLVELLGPVDGLPSVIRSVVGSDRRPLEMALDRARRGRPGALEVGVLHGMEERRCEITLRTLANDTGGIDGVILCAADVTDRSRLRAELEHRASHDELSGCLNRASSVTAIERALKEHEHVALAYIDLDRFKTINDEYGHAAGDELLRVAAARLRTVTRLEDRIGRIGGDEFVVICPQGDGPFEAAALVDRLADAITGDVVIAKQRIPLQASVGVALSVMDEDGAEGLIARADAAMYEAKRARAATRRGMTEVTELRPRHGA